MKEKSELKRNLREEIGTRLAELRGILNISKNKALNIKKTFLICK